MARLLKKLRSSVLDASDDTTVPETRAGASGRLTEDEKRRLVSMLGERHPIHDRYNRYQDVIRDFNRKNRKQVSLRSLVRWAAAAVDGKPLVVTTPCARNGRGNSDKGCFTGWLVPYLNRTFTTRKGLKYRQQWQFWTVREIRFTLLLGVLPPRMAVLGELDKELRARLDKLAIKHGSWQALYAVCIEKALRSEKLPKAVAEYIAQCKEVQQCESTPFNGRVKFCERSIRAALKAGGYVVNPNQAFVGKAPRWVHHASLSSEQSSEEEARVNDVGCASSMPDAGHDDTISGVP